MILGNLGVDGDHPPKMCAGLITAASYPGVEGPRPRERPRPGELEAEEEASGLGGRVHPLRDLQPLVHGFLQRGQLPGNFGNLKITG